MHNLHLCVIKANSPEEACELVQSHIENWGDEDNWRTICGCVSEDDETFEPKYEKEWMNGRWGVKNYTIKSINDLVKTWIDGDDWLKRHGQHLKRNPDIMKWKRGFELYGLKKYVEYCSEYKLLKARNPKFIKSPNVLDDNFYFYDTQYDECGVTQVDVGYDGEKKYVVFVDMHS